jgi:glycerol-3-phosphate dehydrogenase (NAD(P)+)
VTAAPPGGGSVRVSGERALVVGVTAWGLTLAQLLACAGAAVTVLARDGAEAARVRARRTDPARAPAVCLPPTVTVTADPARALAGAGLVVLAVPAQRMRENARRIAPALPAGAVVVSAAKGLELPAGRRMSEVLAAECPRHAGIVALSGPNLADEIARGLPATTVAAAADADAARRVQRALNTPRFRVYTHDDLVGVELGGALKNVVALGAGINDGLGYGDNAKAAFITRGLAEITRLGVAMGANPLTFAGLSGLGDLVATCASPLSRNRRVGEALGRGQPLAEALAALGHVAEGVPTTAAARALARAYGVEMPIVEALYRVLFEGWPPGEAARALMEREPRAELRL